MSRMELPLIYLQFEWVASPRHLRSVLIFYKQVVPLGHRNNMQVYVKFEQIQAKIP